MLETAQIVQLLLSLLITTLIGLLTRASSATRADQERRLQTIEGSVSRTEAEVKLVSVQVREVGEDLHVLEAQLDALGVLRKAG